MKEDEIPQAQSQIEQIPQTDISSDSQNDEAIERALDAIYGKKQDSIHAHHRPIDDETFNAIVQKEQEEEAVLNANGGELRSALDIYLGFELLGGFETAGENNPTLNDIVQRMQADPIVNDAVFSYLNTRSDQNPQRSQTLIQKLKERLGEQA
ncbi:MAG: hypothetical protein JOZ57_02780 [Abitibacteriaceae bacterium]|nr:hypothetical protein [Abditibacteriaceae bacterium]